MKPKTEIFKPDLDDIITVTADTFGLLRQEVTGECRGHTQSLARGIVAMIAYSAGYTFQSIGNKLGRAHSTVLVAKRQAAEDVKYYPEVARKYNSILSKLQGEKRVMEHAA